MHTEDVRERVREIAVDLMSRNYGDAEEKARKLYSALCPKCEGRGTYAGKMDGTDCEMTIACNCCYECGLPNKEEPK